VASALLQKNYAAVTPNRLDLELRRLYHDTADAAHTYDGSAHEARPCLADPCGTDYPFLTSKDNADSLASLDLVPADLAAIRRGNAERLIPRLSNSLIHR